VDVFIVSRTIVDLRAGIEFRKAIIKVDRKPKRKPDKRQKKKPADISI
jgi:hypothetical protein